MATFDDDWERGGVTRADILTARGYSTDGNGHVLAASTNGAVVSVPVGLGRAPPHPKLSIPSCRADLRDVRGTTQTRAGTVLLEGLRRARRLEVRRRRPGQAGYRRRE